MRINLLKVHRECPNCKFLIEATYGRGPYCTVNNEYGAGPVGGCELFQESAAAQAQVKRLNADAEKREQTALKRKREQEGF